MIVDNDDMVSDKVLLDWRRVFAVPSEDLTAVLIDKAGPRAVTAVTPAQDVHEGPESVTTPSFHPKLAACILIWR
jgi:hypothetical protein